MFPEMAVVEANALVEVTLVATVDVNIVEDVCAGDVVKNDAFVAGGSGTYGYDGHGFISCGPSIDSKTYPINEPTVSPTLYDNVIILPVTSFSVAGTLAGASIIGKLPAKPFVMPSAAVNTNAADSPAITG